MNFSSKHKEITIPTLLGLFVAILGLGSGLFLLQGQLRLTSSAAADEAPSAVRITNVTDNSFVVSWYTTKAISGYVKYGEAGKSPDLIVSDERDQQRGEVGNYFTHYVSIRGLKPETKYIFSVGSGRGIYDNDGDNFQVVTGPILNNPPTADVAYGMVLTSSNEPADGALVYVELAGANPLATLAKPTGSWVVSLATARSTDLKSYAIYDKETAELNIYAQGGILGSKSLVTNTGNDSPVPQIVLGSSDTTTVIPTETTAPSELKILTPNVGQSLNNNNVEIVGKAPPGVEVTVEIHSDEVINGTVVAGSDGTFTFGVNTDLSPGEHTITVSALINGVVSKVTRTFTVYAAEEGALPFYSATPSATLIPSPTTAVVTTPIVTLIPTPTVFATPIPTIPPRVTNPATESGMPISGNESITWLLLGAGTLMISGGSIWYRKMAKLS